MTGIEKIKLTYLVLKNEKKMEALLLGVWKQVYWSDVLQKFATPDGYTWDADVWLRTLPQQEIRELVEPFKPKIGDKYWFWGLNGWTWVAQKAEIDSYHIFFLMCIALGNCFSSEAECLAHPEIKEKLEAVQKEVSK